MSKIFIILFFTLALSANNLIVDLLDTQAVNNEVLYHPAELADIYAEHNNTLLWTERSKQLELLNVFALSNTHGFSIEMFHDKTIFKLLEAPLDDEIAQLKLDLLLSDALIHYISTINTGALDPKVFYKIWNLPEKDDDVTVVFEEALRLQGDHFNQYVENLAPQHFIYQNSHKALEHYITLKEDIDVYPPIHFKRTLKLGSDAPVVTEIAHRLYLEGDLNEDLNATLFGEELDTAVKHYQDRHGLKADGVIGKVTAQFFKTTLQEQIDKLAINLERARWVLHHLSKEYVIVNIASYRLYYIKDGEYQFTTPVIVGKKMHETPIFAGKMRYIVYNPTWTVPHSIAVKELLHKAQTRENYMDTFNLELLDHNRHVVDHHSINFHDYNRYNFPYIFRQKPGNHNALGRIKFLFPNKQAIYLHDTPGKTLFSQDKREFSHGCIRVKNPYKLSESILRNQKMWNRNVKRLEGDRQDEMKTTSLTLKHSIEVLLMYWSAAADREGNAYFYEDHYHLDPALLKKLKAIQHPKQTKVTP